MPRPIAFDLTRLYLGALGRTPRGIDRVDLSVARRLFDDPARQDVALVPTPARMGALGADAARRVVGTVERHWREAAPMEGGRTAALAGLQAWLGGQGGAAAAPARSRVPAVPFHLGAMVGRSVTAGLRPAVRAVPPGAVYLNTGQVLLGFPWPFGWLDRRPDVKVVFTLHDLIPITHPEYSGPALSRHHSRALANAARRATALLATSHASAAEIRDALARLGRPAMPIHVVPLPVSPSLLQGAAATGPAASPYFVTVGILDQRKNHRLLLHVWRAMLQHLGPDATPRLVIVGARGLRVGELTAFIDRVPGLSGVVRLVSGLPSPAMRGIVQGARALLMPSFSEGFGLPVIEARALGVPVIASDIPAHREVGGPDTVFLHPLDGPGWREAVLRFARGAPRPPAAPDAPPQTWERYFAAVLPFLESL